MEDDAVTTAGEGEGKPARKRASSGKGMPSSKKKRRQEDGGTQLLKVLLSSPSLSVEQVKKKMAAELDSISQVMHVSCVHWSQLFQTHSSRTSDKGYRTPLYKGHSLIHRLNLIMYILPLNEDNLPDCTPLLPPSDREARQAAARGSHGPLWVEPRPSPPAISPEQCRSHEGGGA